MTLTFQAAQRIPAQARKAEKRQHDVAQQRVAREQGDDLIGARQSQMRAAARRQARELLTEQRHRAAIGAQLAGDQVEQRRLAGAVGTDDEAALARRDGEIDAARDAEAAERLLELSDRQRGHGRASSAARAARPLNRRRTSRVVPGTKPSGMKMTMATKIAPSSMFQRSI